MRSHDPGGTRERSTAPPGAQQTHRFPKSIRLPSETYREGHAFSVTVSTAERRRIFVEAAITELALACLKECALKAGANVYAYCFMPDHLHLLASTSNGTDFSEFIRLFKQTSSYRLRRKCAGRHVWQPSCYDHALRSSEDLETVADYILNNPVRAGLVAAGEDYFFSGSLVWKLPLEGPSVHVPRESRSDSRPSRAELTQQSATTRSTAPSGALPTPRHRKGPNTKGAPE